MSSGEVAGEIELGGRERQSGDVSSAGLRQADGQGPPATANLQDPLAALDIEQVEDALDLPRLGGFEGRRRAVPESGRVEHGFVEPDPEKVVAEIVVGDDVAGASAPGVVVQEMPKAERQPGERRSLGPAEPMEVARRKPDERGQVQARAIAVDPGLGEADVAAGEQAPKRPPPVQDDARFGAGFAADPNEFLPGRQGHAERAVAQALEKARQYPHPRVPAPAQHRRPLAGAGKARILDLSHNRQTLVIRRSPINHER